jgi:phosphoribosyl 1,2-cyclic phosphodiesterase
MSTKQIIINSTITVDYWPKRNNSKFTHSFLTHAHSDHMRGLNSKWNGPTIYCSEVSHLKLSG